MAKGSWNIAAHATKIIDAQKDRIAITVQLWNGHPVYLAFNEPAVIGEGICLLAPGDSIRLVGSIAKSEIHAVCVEAAQGGWQDGSIQIMVTGRINEAVTSPKTQVLEGTIVGPPTNQVFEGTITEQTE